MEQDLKIQQQFNCNFLIIYFYIDMKALEFNVLRMILLMEIDYSFCEAFEKEGFSPDVEQLRNTYDAFGKVNHKAEQALKRIYKELVVGDALKAYNEIVLPPEVMISDTLKIAQILESNVPEGVIAILTGREDFADNTTNGDKLYGASAIEDAHIETIDGTEADAAQEDKDFLNELRIKMGAKDYSYIQLIK